MGKSHVNFMGRSSDILVMADRIYRHKLAHVVKIPESPVVSEIAMKFHDLANSLWVHNGGNPLAFLSKVKIFTDVNVASCKNVVDNDEFTRLMREEKFDIGITES
uniref:CBS domain-containing protein n=1 Tax=Rhabditophanes sp. KR3021 TaxID=114890 RepID=A0AC35U981_9BILA